MDYFTFFSFFLKLLGNKLFQNKYISASNSTPVFSRCFNNVGSLILWNSPSHLLKHLTPPFMKSGAKLQLDLVEMLSISCIVNSLCLCDVCWVWPQAHFTCHFLSEISILIYCRSWVHFYTCQILVFSFHFTNSIDYCQ